jgi:K+-transporting ATPase ATPase C chain
MSAHLRANLNLLLWTVGLYCVAYPIVLWGFGQTFFHERANGSLIFDGNGQAIGSRLIAQPFTRPEYFWPRPSAVAYDAGASGASNWSASNPKLRARVVQTLDHLKGFPSAPNQDVPADLVMTSGSGLDPHITLKNALYQLDRVAAAWAAQSGANAESVRKEIVEILNREQASPLSGWAGVPLVNVLAVNLQLHDHFGARARAQSSVK